MPPREVGTAAEPAAMPDAPLPYAGDDDRFSLLYRLPSDERMTGRACIVRSGTDGRRLDLQRPSDVVDRARFESEECDAGRWAVVALPATLDPLTRELSGRLLSRAVERLLPGGALVGHVRHRHSIRNMARRWLVRSGDANAGWATGALRRQLLQAGLADVELYYVRPSIDSPLALVPTTPAAANAVFSWSIRSARGDHGRLGYWARRLVTLAGAGWLLQDTILFWGYRAEC